MVQQSKKGSGMKRIVVYRKAQREYLNRSTDIYGGMANAAPPKIQIALWIEKGVI